MVAGLLPQTKLQLYPFENHVIRIHFTFLTKISGVTLLSDVNVSVYVTLH